MLGIAGLILVEGHGNSVSGVTLQEECLLLQDHAHFLKDGVLGAELVHPFMGLTHLNGNGEFVDLRDGVATALVRSRRVGDELAEIVPVIQFGTKEFSKGISSNDGVVTLLVKAFDINVCGNVVSLRLCEW